MSLYATQKNILQAQSDTLGVTTNAAGRIDVTSSTLQHPAVFGLFARWLEDNMPLIFIQPFPFTSITMTCGCRPSIQYFCFVVVRVCMQGQHCVSSCCVHIRFAAPPHRDQQIVGASMMKSFGTFTGGAFLYWEYDDGITPMSQLSVETARTYDTQREMVLFDGGRCHAVAAFEGECYSLVFSTCESYLLLAQKSKKKLAEIGAIWPA